MTATIYHLSLTRFWPNFKIGFLWPTTITTTTRPTTTTTKTTTNTTKKNNNNFLVIILITTKITKQFEASCGNLSTQLYFYLLRILKRLKVWQMTFENSCFKVVKTFLSSLLVSLHGLQLYSLLSVFRNSTVWGKYRNVLIRLSGNIVEQAGALLCQAHCSLNKQPISCDCCC